MARFKRARFTSTLPPTPCTNDMRKSVIGLATQQNKSLAELQREAIALFLQGNIGDIDIDINDTNPKGQPLAVGVDHATEDV